MAEGSPYYEAFKRSGIEVLFCYQEHDEIVLGNLGKYKDKFLKSIEVVEPPKVEVDAETGKEDGDKEADKGGGDSSDVRPDPAAGALEASEVTELTGWLKEALLERVSDVQTTDRLVDSPAIISDHDNAVTRRMLQMAEIKQAICVRIHITIYHIFVCISCVLTHATLQMGVTRQSHYKLLINPSHALVLSLNRARKEAPETAKLVAEQLLDNAVISAGILDDVREMLPRLSKLMQAALDKR